MKIKTIAVCALAVLGTTAVLADKGMKNADKSGDGFVSLEEFRAAHDARVEERFTRMDANADGLLSEDELQAAREARRGDRESRRGDRHRGKKNPEKLLQRLDADSSGGVSFDELDGKRFSPDIATFQAADSDGSGELNATEMHEMMKARRAERRAAHRGEDD